jgi:hypothetical protein
MQPDRFVELVINHPNGGIGALLEITGSQEVEWLEFKAAACDRMEPKSEQTRDLQWRIARAVIAMANSRGGCVVIGIADDGSHVPISHSDPEAMIERFGREYFLRKSIVEKILQPEKGWKAKPGRMTLDRNLPDFCFEVRLAEYSSQSVVLIIVHPLPLGAELLRVVNEDVDREFFPIRQPGHVGCVRELSRTHEILDHSKQRRLDSLEVLATWAKFNEAQQDPDSQIEIEVEAYVSTIRTNLARLSLEFTNLDGSQREDMKEEQDLLIPNVDEVTRWIDPDNTWSSRFEIEEGGRTESVISYTPHFSLPRKQSVLQLLNDVNRAVLLGRPGSGKTTCLQRIALQAAQESSPGKRLTIFAPLAIYGKGGIFPLLRRVSNVSLTNLEHLAQSRRLCLLLDGLNECPTALLEACISELELILHRFPDLCVVISSRTNPYRTALKLPTFEVLPLSEDQQLKFLETRTGNRERAAEVLEQLKLSPSSRSVASNPQLLAIASEVARISGQVPSGLGNLYSAYISKWFEREQKKALRSQEPLPWDKDLVVEAFSTLAFKMRIAGTIACEPSFAVDALQGIVSEPQAFIERLAQGLLFVFNPVQSTFNFEHETLQEFLCAVYMATRPEAVSEATEPAQSRDRWRMPFAFLFEIGIPAEDIVDRIWRRDPLIVAMAIRQDSDLARMDNSTIPDVWVRGIIHAIRREPVSESRDIQENFLSGPTPDLRRTVRSDAFWYAGLTHAAGIKRIERFESLIEKSPEPWADLLRDACAGNPDWLDHWRLKDSRFLLVCCGLDDLPDHEYMQEVVPVNAQSRLLARLVYQRSISREIWTSSPWVRGLFFRGPWFKIPSLLSARQWRIAINKGALGSPARRKPDSWLLSQLVALDAVLPTLVRLGIVGKDQLAPKKIQRSLKYLDSRDVAVFAREGLLKSKDISDERLREWTVRGNVKMFAELIGTGLVSTSRILSSVEASWPVGKRIALLKTVVDSFAGGDKEIIAACLQLCSPLESVAEQLLAVDLVGEEKLPGSYIVEASSALQMPIKDSADLTYLLASVNLLNAVANRLRRDETEGWTKIQILVEAAKRRLGRELFEAASSSFPYMEIYLSAESSYARAYGIQFGFRSLPVGTYSEQLDSKGLNVAQEWWGRRLQPIARSVLDWARILRGEHRDTSAAVLEKLKMADTGPIDSIGI